MNGADFIKYVLNREPYKTMITDFYSNPVTISGVELDLYYLRQYLVDKRITAKKLAEESGEDVTFVRQAIHTQTKNPSQKLIEAIERLVSVDTLKEISKRSMHRIVPLGPNEKPPEYFPHWKILREEIAD